MQVPLKVYIDFVKTTDRGDEYRFTMGFPSKTIPQFCASVLVTEDGDRTLNEIEAGDLAQVPFSIRTAFASLMFRFCYSEMRAADGSAIERTFADVTALVLKAVSEDDRPIVLENLAAATTPGAAVQSISLVRVD